MPSGGSGPLVFSENLFGSIRNNWIVYGLFFVGGWMDPLGGILPNFAFIDLGVMASAWLGGALGLMIGSMGLSPDYVMAPAIPALVAGVATAVLCGMIQIQYCRAIALFIGILYWNMYQSGKSIGLVGSL